MKKILSQLAELEHNIANASITNTTISQVPVGWHIEHSLLVINKVVETLEKSNPADYKSKFSFLKIVIFITKKIPRGKVKAPKHVQPSNNYTTESLTQHIQLAQAAINKISLLQPNNHFDHPIFGKLNVKQVIPFLTIHTHHHLKIITDIIKARQ